MSHQTKNSFSAAIFDLDGVVVNTVPFHFEAWKEMFGEYGKKFTFDDYKAKVDGIPRFEGAKAVLTDLSDEKVQKACDKKQTYFLSLITKAEIPRYDSTFQLIDELKSHAVKIAAISASRNCRAILKRIGAMKVMDAIVDGGDVVKGKPDPEMFLAAARQLQSESSSCVVFEDAVLGVEAAKRAGMRCVGIDRYNHPERLQKADIVVSDLTEVNYEKLLTLFV